MAWRFLNVLYLLAKLAWWQHFLGAEEWTCLQSGWTGGMLQLGLALLASPRGITGIWKAQQEKEGPAARVPKSPRVPRKCLAWSHAPSRRQAWGTQLQFRDGNVVSLYPLGLAVLWTQQPPRLECQDVIFSHFESWVVKSFGLANLGKEAGHVVRRTKSKI